ncbi:hypothetical protein SAMN06265337_0286 [Hymenobacter gelipurpurascens]|uniref:Uncharacterized protein n=1 Tax=Hymenobacter gelipurpurascens TaxID=89968 RepID=A0A212T3X3_9BACT|nr:hypothetical protein [Hymenobacter gelipurpurascens]SNC60570.1 hypothetical protein SAMN06265337_0286 [Hymenobacter gelipurpurascens]
MPSPLRLLVWGTLILAYSYLFFNSLTHAQTLTREWDRPLGNAGENTLNRMRPTTDGGYILGAQTDPESGGDVSEKAYGVIEYWDWVVELDAQGKK